MVINSYIVIELLNTIFGENTFRFELVVDSFRELQINY